MLGIVGTAPYLRGMMRSPKISRKRRCEIFYKNEELTKRRDSGKKGEYLIFYCVNYRVDMAILKLLAKLELIESLH